MQQKVENYIQKHKLLTLHEPLIIGVSGGADSMALLHILMSLGYNCIVAHCNFHLRTTESDTDELFVRNYALSHKLEFHSIDFDTIRYSEDNKISIEMAARDLRYNWFNELMQKHKAQAIAVAHHADDNIETMLMNLVRGTGFRGLTGIQPRNENVIRPLLCLSRMEIEYYLTQYNLEHIEDSSNASSVYKRNKFRNEVLPLLTEINPSIRQTLYDSLERFKGSYSIYQQAIANIEKEIVHKKENTISIDIEKLKKQIDISTILYELLQSYGFSAATIKLIENQLNAEPGRLFYSDSHRLLKDRNQLIITAKELNFKEVYFISEFDTEISQPIHLNISTCKVTADFSVSKLKNRVHIDASMLEFPLILRRWQEGDVFIPYGMNQRKKVSDFFIDNKLSLFEKENTWILVSGNDIVWIVGQRVDNRYAVTSQTINVLEFSI